MVKRRLLLLLAVAGLATLALAVLDARQGPLPFRPGVTTANFWRLRPGMSRQQAEALFGGPSVGCLGTTCGPDGCWVGEHCQVSIWFVKGVERAELRGDDGRAVTVFKSDEGDGWGFITYEGPPSLWEQLRRGLPW
jgi:hypothetical protein